MIANHSFVSCVAGAGSGGQQSVRVGVRGQFGRTAGVFSYAAPEVLERVDEWTLWHIRLQLRLERRWRP